MRVAETAGMGIRVAIFGLAWWIALGCIPQARAGSQAAHPGSGLAPVRSRPAGSQPVARARYRASRLGQLRSEEVVLEAQLAIAKLRAEISRIRRRGCNGVNNPSASGIGRGSHAADDLLLLPEVRSIEGFGGVTHAVVQYPDGSRETVAVGTPLEDGLHVIRVDASGVTVDARHGIRTLPFAASPGGTRGLQIRSLMAPPSLPVLPAMPVHDARHAGDWGNG